MKKPMKVMLISVGILFGGIFGYKFFKNMMIKKFMASQSDVATVSVMKVEYSPWQPQLSATGSLRAMRGINVTTELAGLVQKIYFTPGESVKQGTLLVQLNVDADVALLHSLEANQDLAKTTYNRDKAQFAVGAISQATLDTDLADLRSKEAQVNEQLAIIAKKTIHAPFSGKLGISEINPGQYLNPGDKIVSLQELDPIYVDFYIPQQQIIQLGVNQPVNLSIDTFPHEKFSGKITTIDPIIDLNTRNVEVEATLNNIKYKLVPGMFAAVSIETGKPLNYLTLPQTAISFNPYGEVVFVVKQTKPNPTVAQVFVTTGEKRGDQIQILSGLKEGDMVVTSGQIKLKNGSAVEINNTVVPANNPSPSVVNE